MSNITSGGVDGLVVVLTGASAGIGESLADGLHAAGARLVLAGRRADRLDALAERLPGAVAAPGDVTVDADREQLIAAAVQRFGRLDGLVNNAGLIRGGPAADETTEDFRLQLETNLVAPFALARLAAPRMREGGGGSIVNVSSVMGRRSVRELPAAGYVASKAGLIGLTRELASQWGRHGVRVNAVAPGLFPSEMTTRLIAPDGTVPDWLVEATPLQRPGRSGELTAAVAYLLGASSSFVTGQVLGVDGGVSAR